VYSPEKVPRNALPPSLGTNVHIEPAALAVGRDATCFEHDFLDEQLVECRSGGSTRR